MIIATRCYTDDLQDYLCNAKWLKSARLPSGKDPRFESHLYGNKYSENQSSDLTRPSLK